MIFLKSQMLVAGNRLKNLSSLVPVLKKSLTLGGELRRDIIEKATSSQIVSQGFLLQGQINLTGDFTCNFV